MTIKVQLHRMNLSWHRSSLRWAGRPMAQTKALDRISEEHQVFKL